MYALPLCKDQKYKFSVSFRDKKTFLTKKRGACKSSLPSSIGG